MKRELLEQPFGELEIKYRDGKFGQSLAYVSGHTIIKRLNDVFESAWSFEIVSHELHQDEVIVIGKLTAGDIVKCQFGSSRVTRARETGEIVSLADDLKAATTDSLKKCATLLGVGLHLYSDKPSSETKTDAKGNGGEESPAGGNGNGNGRLTPKQHSFLLKLANERGMTRQELNDRSVETYGSVVDFLSRQNASNMIETMLA